MLRLEILAATAYVLYVISFFGLLQGAERERTLRAENDLLRGQAGIPLALDLSTARLIRIGSDGLYVCLPVNSVSLTVAHQLFRIVRPS